MSFNVLPDDWVLSSRELYALGIGRGRLQRGLAAGRIRRVAYGVYAAAPGERGAGADRWIDAVRTALLLGGPNVVLARASAAALWHLDGFRPPPLPIELNAPARTGGSRRVNLRRTHPLEPPDAIDGVPTTSIGQTLVELGSTITPSPLPPADRVELALECALHRHLITLEAVADLAHTARNRHGAATLRVALRRRPDGAPPTESYLETRMVQLLRDHGLPDPSRQVTLRDGRGVIGRVDFLLGQVVIEVDGRETHDNPAAFQRDRARWSRLQAAGYRPLLFTHDRIEFDGRTVAAIVKDTVAAAA